MGKKQQRLQAPGPRVDTNVSWRVLFLPEESRHVTSKLPRKKEEEEIGAHLEQLCDLVLNERQQRGHHERDPLAETCRKLVAQRLSSSSRHKDKTVASTESCPDHLRPGPKRADTYAARAGYFSEGGVGRSKPLIL